MDSIQADFLSNYLKFDKEHVYLPVKFATNKVTNIFNNKL